MNISLHKAVKDVLDEFDFMKNESDNAELFTSIEALRQAVTDHIVDANKMVYKPMTDDEWCEWLDGGIPSGLSYSFYKELEAHILARMGIEVGK